jgi:hypothetical protein
MTARGAGDLKRQARNDACAFAKRQTNTTRVLLMDFGKSERHDGHWGTQLRTGPHFTNQHILDALKAGAHVYRGHGPCYTRGSVRFTYGNTNNLPEWMSNRAARQAGRRQARMANRLQKYQVRQGFHYQGVAVAGDIEPQWNPPKITKDMVQGATAHKRGGLYFNYGAASECPPEGKRCAKGWDVKDLATVSYGGIRRALPEIYRRVHAKQWTRVRRYWNNNHKRRFCFYGATSTPGFPVSMRESWARLRAKNRCVKRELVNIREQ